MPRNPKPTAKEKAPDDAGRPISPPSASSTPLRTGHLLLAIVDGILQSLDRPLNEGASRGNSPTFDFGKIPGAGEVFEQSLCKLASFPRRGLSHFANDSGDAALSTAHSVGKVAGCFHQFMPMQNFSAVRKIFNSRILADIAV